MTLKTLVRSTAATLVLLTAVSVAGAVQTADPGRWVTGDFHSHTWLTDGTHTERQVVGYAFEIYGLDWLANSEHGGISRRDPEGRFWDDAAIAGKVTLEGDPVFFEARDWEHPAMWRWQSLAQFSWPILFGGTDGFGEDLPGLQSYYQQKVLIQGLEWNIPHHDHASVGIVGQPDPAAISSFEYVFDAADTDTSKGMDIAKHNADSADMIAAAEYLRDNYGANSYIVLNHPSRKQVYTITDIRDLINAAPDVVIGLEGMPGHQKQSVRGSYGRSFYTSEEKTTLDQAKTDRARTYGGADIMLAQVGGLMDALWGEGRHFWVFANSDFHTWAEDDDFWPGEYIKTYFYVTELTPEAIVTAMRSGTVFFVYGDLINALDFRAMSGNTTMTMGQELKVEKGTDVTITVRFKSPDKNNNGDTPVVDHIDLISGVVTAPVEPGSEKYGLDTNPTSRVVATFTSRDWTTDAEGFQVITYSLPKLEQNLYLRLRGTNLGMNVENETQDGNPLIDDLMGENNLAKAYADLWFYSNPIFISPQ
jgi:hypothetical protein